MIPLNFSHYRSSLDFLKAEVYSKWTLKVDQGKTRCGPDEVRADM